MNRETPTQQKLISIVPDGYTPMRLDVYLAGRFTYLSRSKWQKEIKSGKIFVNNIPITIPHYTVYQHYVIEYRRQPVEEPQVDPTYTILYEDEYIIAINKSGNLPTHPAGKYFHNTLTMLLWTQTGTQCMPLNRLDRETSGVVVLAKSGSIASAFLKYSGAIAKKYYAIVIGNCSFTRITVDTPIGISHDSRIRKKRAAYTDAKWHSITHFSVLKRYNNYTLIKAVPITGRTHQIRVHCEHIGHPILGDTLYSSRDEDFITFIQNKGAIERSFPRCALHARMYRLYHPYLQKMIAIKAPLPHDMHTFLTQLENNNGATINTTKS
ncbi:MAG: RluA family pseudouridine synthase [Spirochaetes bacterium]|nr:RluA family pseudouridine synthase [Spirochaetota bacterium]